MFNEADPVQPTPPVASGPNPTRGSGASGTKTGPHNMGTERPGKEHTPKFNTTKAFAFAGAFWRSNRNIGLPTVGSPARTCDMLVQAAQPPEAQLLPVEASVLGSQLSPTNESGQELTQQRALEKEQVAAS